MIKRTLFFNNPYYLSTKDEQLFIASKETGELKTVPIEDVGFVIIDHPQVALSVYSIDKLCKNNVSIVFCDQKHLPSSIVYPLAGNATQNLIYREQIGMKEALKKNLWKQTIRQKIKNQAGALECAGKEFKDLHSIAGSVKSGDTSNREAYASKIYWSRLFANFKRAREGTFPNALLNYGYAIIRAAVARGICGSGLLPTLGIHHHNKYNAFCLADDLMEPYRPFVDLRVFELQNEFPDKQELDTDLKREMLGLLTVDACFDKVKRPLMLGISQTSSSMASCILGEKTEIDYPLLPGEK